MRIEYRLLDRAVRYALSAAGHATPRLLTAATPCPEWDLGQLLAHLGDSLKALAEGLSVRSVGLIPTCCGAEGSAGAPSAPEAGDGQGLIAGLAVRSAVLLAACAEVPGGQEPVAVGDQLLTTSVVAITGAIEVAVHGWDISVSCGDHEPVPSRLATELLPYAALLVPRHTRPGLFADPVLVPRRTSAGDRLVAFLGRQPAGTKVVAEPDGS
ncbi:MAG TPA: maleylpyruvate isomerase family mycothiol-dependent enzyme [Streptosporangiaceae bacterium]|nr:maleylpyruvate isomerase family mycothiol-dependent enzyme [Streptosporangiaceae bacterium]